jgi:hypothetical protein
MGGIYERVEMAGKKPNPFAKKGKMEQDDDKKGKPNPFEKFAKKGKKRG